MTESTKRRLERLERERRPQQPGYFLIMHGSETMEDVLKRDHGLDELPEGATAFCVHFPTGGKS